APLVAGFASMLATRAAYRITDHTAKHSANVFRQGQRISASMVALAHGTSDGQKTMGIITLVLVTGKLQEPGTGPKEWVIIAAALAIALGTYSGGWRIMRTMGKRLVDIQPPQGFAAETSAATAILASAHLGFGLSTTHVCSGAIIGSGVGGQVRVNWAVARQMLYAWLLTLPAAALIGALASWLAHRAGTYGFVIDLVLLAAVTGVILVLANRNKVSHHNVNDVEGEAEASTGRLAAIGPGPGRPVLVLDSISWTSARDQVSLSVGLTAQSGLAPYENAPDQAGAPHVLSVADVDTEDEADAVTDTSIHHTLRDWG
ncbi:MAG: inorganic phosphate transporter, partial [Actinomycetia bacterium]|nr:inorganic phosphate transporter [Actinomycetes bacterium]